MKGNIFAVLLCSLMLLCSCQNGDKREEVEVEITESTSEVVTENERIDSMEKGYDLPIEEEVKVAAESDCKDRMLQIKEIYTEVDKGNASNKVIGEETAGKMRLILQESGCPVTVRGFTYNMVNYEEMEKFLKDSLGGRAGEIVTYEIHSDGGIGRRQFIFDGADMYVLDTNAVWKEENEPGITYTSYTRIKEWKYTTKGYFEFAYCVPEPPEVSEVVNGNVLIRVKPQEEKNMEIAGKYLLPIGYHGNNLLCSDWDAEHMDKLDYNGLFQYLYFVEYKEQPDMDQYIDGVAQEEFERLIMKYLPVTAEQLRQYASYDAENQTYACARLGCLNYAPTDFGTSCPEITDIQENEDGTVTLTVDAVCEMSGDDAVMSHRLTVSFPEEGGIVYLGNEILESGTGEMTNQP